MSTAEQGDRELLADLMNRSRAKQRMTWDDVASRGGISVALLRNIRNARAPITLDSEVRIELGLGVPDGWVKRALAGNASPDERRPASASERPSRSADTTWIATVQLARVLVAGGNYVGALNRWRGRLGEDADIPAIAGEAHRLSEHPDELRHACDELGLPYPGTDGDQAVGEV